MSKDDVLNDVINNLTDDLGEVKPLRHPLIRMLPWFAVTTAYIALIINMIGIRYDFEDKLAQIPYVSELVLCLFLAITAAMSSAYLSVPDFYNKKFLPYLPLAGFGVFCAYYGFSILSTSFYMPEFTWHYCMEDGLLMVGVPILMMIIIMRKGATTRPILMASNNIIAAGLLGWAGLRITCAADDLGHLFMYHFVPFIALGVILTLSARALYKW